MDVSDLIDSDQRILSHSKRIAENGTSLITFDWGDGSPPFKGVMPEKMDPSILSEWCVAVRSAYHARKASKETKKDRPAAVVRGAPEQEGPPPGVGSGGGVAVEANGTDPKEVVANAIEAQIAEMGRREAATTKRIGELEADLAVLRGQHAQLSESLMYLNNLKEKL